MNPEAVKRREEHILRILKVEQLTVAQLAPEVFISKRWLHPYIERLHSAGKIHICGWKMFKGGGGPAPIYKAGPGRDKPKPPSKDGATKSREYRARLKADPDRHEMHLKKRRAKNIRPYRDPLLFWISPRKPSIQPLDLNPPNVV